MGSPQDPMWNKPEFEMYRQLRDSSPMLPSTHTAKELVDKIEKGRSLSAPEREYLKRFYSGNVTQEFFCRLEFPMQQIRNCWKAELPTDEQCSQCEILHRHAFSTKDEARGKLKETNGKPLVLYAFRDSKDVLRFRWKSPDETTSNKALVGLSFEEISVNIKTPLSRVYPVCIPGLSKTFQGGCDRVCSQCPAQGLYDSVKKVMITNNGSVVIPELTEAMRKKLDALSEQDEQGGPSP
jgi:hypothetical protein